MAVAVLVAAVVGFVHVVIRNRLPLGRADQALPSCHLHEHRHGYSMHVVSQEHWGSTDPPWYGS